jgi:hypothetical protein
MMQCSRYRVVGYVAAMSALHVIIVTAILGLAASLLGCAGDATPNPTGVTPTTVRRVTDYTFRRVIGSSVTLQFRTLSFTEGSDTSVVQGSSYRYTVVDTAFVRTDGRRCLAIQRETIDNGVVRFTDTTHQFADSLELITFERMSDSVGRRRLQSPVRPGTSFWYRSTFGNVESNRYAIVGVDVPVQTSLGELSATHVRMFSTSLIDNGTRSFSDEQWLVPGMHIVLQRQTNRFDPSDGSAATTSVSEFVIVERNW